MEIKNIKRMISNNHMAIGLNMNIPTPAVAEIAGLSGCDFVVIDLEHQLFNLETVANIVRAADSVNMGVIAKIRTQTGAITSLLNSGVIGIMATHVRSAKQAKDIVDLVKCTPIGCRNVSVSGRAVGFGNITVSDYMKQANDETVLIIGIEDKEGIENIDEILAVKGIDLVSINRSDISLALGVTGEVNDPKVVNIENKIIETAKRNGVGFHVITNSEEELKYYINLGLSAVTVGDDVSILYKEAKEQGEEMRALRK